MKKRKIFYFLKTKEEYDYMLTNGMIPKRGIVLIESTQEIYRNKVPYSGYGPLKTYFELVKSDLLSLILDKTEDVSSMVELIDLKLLGDVNGYNEQFAIKLNKLQTLISQNKSDLSNLTYYVNNTLVPSLTQTKDKVEDLDNKYTDVLVLLSSNLSLVTLFKSKVQELISGVLDFKSTYNSELTSIRSSINGVTSGNSTSSSSLSESRVRSIVNEMMLTDSQFLAKTRSIVDPLLNSLRNELNTRISTIVAGQQGTQGTQGVQGNYSSYLAVADYALNLFNTHATTMQHGTIMVGDHISVNENGVISLDLSELRTALGITNNPSSDPVPSSGYVSLSDFNTLSTKVNTLVTLISSDGIAGEVSRYMQAHPVTPTINWNDINWVTVVEGLTINSGFVLAVKTALSKLGYPTAITGYTGTKNGLTFNNGICIVENSGSDVIHGGDEPDLPDTDKPNGSQSGNQSGNQSNHGTPQGEQFDPNVTPGPLSNNTTEEGSLTGQNNEELQSGHQLDPNALIVDELDNPIP